MYIDKENSTNSTVSNKEIILEMTEAVARNCDNVQSSAEVRSMEDDLLGGIFWQ